MHVDSLHASLDLLNSVIIGLISPLANCLYNYLGQTNPSNDIARLLQLLPIPQVHSLLIGSLLVYTTELLIVFRYSTTAHPPHLGLAGWLAGIHGTRATCLSARKPTPSATPFLEAPSAVLSSHGYGRSNRGILLVEQSEKVRPSVVAGPMAILVLAVLLGQASPSPSHLDVRVPAHDDEYARQQYPSVAQDSDGPSFAFVVTADMRNYTGSGQYNTSQYFRGAVEAIAALDGPAFMVSPGDFDPPIDALWTITQTMGAQYTWYPVVGNHELPGAGQEATPGENMNWLRSYGYGAVNPGPTGCPTTTYSFDYNNAHFVMLNEYCDVSGDDVTAGDVPDHLYNWLVNDLNATDKGYVFVFGHEPAYPQADADNGRTRHVGDSLDQYPVHRLRFWDLLRDRGVTAYICGHTHNYSALQIDGVWQLDAGHARGLGDTGARSTFIMIYIYGDKVRFETYRDDSAGGSYTRMHVGFLHGAQYLYLPLVVRNWL